MILNCLCRQCKLASGRNSMYKIQKKRVRRNVKQMINHYVSHNVFDFDVPIKFRGKFAA